jgi:hypothetical protein
VAVVQRGPAAGTWAVVNSAGEGFRTGCLPVLARLSDDAAAVPVDCDCVGLAAGGRGLVTGIIGGVLAGAALAVSGPAAGLTVLLFHLVQQHWLAGDRANQVKEPVGFEGYDAKSGITRAVRMAAAETRTARIQFFAAC